VENGLSYQKELERYSKSKGIWDYKKKRPDGFVINRKKDIILKHPDGTEYKQNINDRFTTKRPHQKICLYCHTELNPKQERFCSSKHRDLMAKARKKAHEQGGESIIVFKEPDFIPKWNKIQVIHRDEKGRLYTKPLTNKKGKLN